MPQMSPVCLAAGFSVLGLRALIIVAMVSCGRFHFSPTESMNSWLRSRVRITGASSVPLSRYTCASRSTRAAGGLSETYRTARRWAMWCAVPGWCAR